MSVTLHFVVRRGGSKGRRICPGYALALALALSVVVLLSLLLLWLLRGLEQWSLIVDCWI